MALTAPRPSEVENSVAASDPAQGLQVVRRAMADALLECGFAGAVYMHLGHGLRSALDLSVKPRPRRLVATRGFDEAQYLRRNYLEFDPLAVSAANSPAPFAWTLDDLQDEDPGRRRFLAVLDSWGMRSGVVAPVHDYALGPAFLNLYDGERRRCGRVGEQGAVMLAAVRVHLAAVGVPTGTSEATEAARLSPREMEVLRLAALGRTEQETALELALSRRGVQFHLGRAVEKLGASNKTAAVAKAVGVGLIRI